eukprot:Clim_evm6s148 gene=Clim_evmTU6s148
MSFFKDLFGISKCCDPQFFKHETDRIIVVQAPSSEAALHTLPSEYHDDDETGLPQSRGTMPAKYQKAFNRALGRMLSRHGNGMMVCNFMGTDIFPPLAEQFQRNNVSVVDFPNTVIQPDGTTPPGVAAVSTLGMTVKGWLEADKNNTVLIACCPGQAVLTIACVMAFLDSAQLRLLRQRLISEQERRALSGRKEKPRISPRLSPRRLMRRGSSSKTSSTKPSRRASNPSAGSISPLRLSRKGSASTGPGTQAAKRASMPSMGSVTSMQSDVGVTPASNAGEIENTQGRKGGSAANVSPARKIVIANLAATNVMKVPEQYEYEANKWRARHLEAFRSKTRSLGDNCPGLLQRPVMAERYLNLYLGMLLESNHDAHELVNGKSMVIEGIDIHGVPNMSKGGSNLFMMIIGHSEVMYNSMLTMCGPVRCDKEQTQRFKVPKDALMLRDDCLIRLYHRRRNGAIRPLASVLICPQMSEYIYRRKLKEVAEEEGLIIARNAEGMYILVDPRELMSSVNSDTHEGMENLVLRLPATVAEKAENASQGSDEVVVTTAESLTDVRKSPKEKENALYTDEDEEDSVEVVSPGQQPVLQGSSLRSTSATGPNLSTSVSSWSMAWSRADFDQELFDDRFPQNFAIEVHFRLPVAKGTKESSSSSLSDTEEEELVAMTGPDGGASSSSACLAARVESECFPRVLSRVAETEGVDFGPEVATCTANAPAGEPQPRPSIEDDEALARALQAQFDREAHEEARRRREAQAQQQRRRSQQEMVAESHGSDRGSELRASITHVTALSTGSDESPTTRRSLTVPFGGVSPEGSQLRTSGHLLTDLAPAPAGTAGHEGFNAPAPTRLEQILQFASVESSDEPATAGLGPGPMGPGPLIHNPGEQPYRVRSVGGYIFRSPSMGTPNSMDMVRASGHAPRTNAQVDDDRRMAEVLQEELALESTQRRHGVNPDIRALVARLPTMKWWTTMSAKECQVCREEFEPGHAVKLLPCFHTYHTACIDPWLIRRGACPVCQTRIDAGLEHDEEHQAEVARQQERERRRQELLRERQQMTARSRYHSSSS